MGEGLEVTRTLDSPEEKGGFWKKILWVVAGAQLVQCLPSGIPDPIPILQKSLVLTVVAHGFNPSAPEAETSLVCRASPRTVSGTQRNPA